MAPGTLQVANGAASAGYTYQTVASTAGQWFEVTLTGSNFVTTTQMRFGAGNGGVFGYTSSIFNVNLSAGTYTYRVMATGTSTTFAFFVNEATTIGASVNFSGFSIKPVAGRHGLQASSSLRPLLGRAPISRRNLVGNSEDASVAAQVNSTVLTNVLRAPDGSWSADKIVENTAAAAHQNAHGITGTAGLTYTSSTFLKAGERSVVSMQTGSPGGNANVTVNLLTGVVSNATNCTAGSVDVGGGWWRVWITYTWATTGSNFLYVTVSDGVTSAYTGDGTSGAYRWGTQHELGATMTAYQRVGTSNLDMIEPVIGGAAQRNLLTRTQELAHSDWVKQGTGTVVGTFAVTAPDGSPTCDLVTLGAVANAGIRVGGSPLVVGTQYTLSFYHKIGPTGSGSVSIVSGSGISLGSYTPTSEWQRHTLTFTAAQSQVFPAFLYGAGGIQIYMWGVQIEAAAAATAYERVGAYWEPAHAVPAYGFLRSDLVDDQFIVNLATGGTGTLVLAGRNGCYVETLTRGSGDWPFHGAASAGNNAGTSVGAIWRAVGDLVGVFWINRVLAAGEKSRVLKFYQQRGAGGELVEGPELVTNGDGNDVTGWLTSGCDIASVGGQLRITSTVASGTPLAYQVVSGLTPGGIVVSRTTATRLDANSAAAQGIINDTAPATGQLASAGSSTGSVSTQSHAFFAPADGDVAVGIRLATVPAIGAQADFDNVSLKQLIPQALVA